MNLDDDYKTSAINSRNAGYGDGENSNLQSRRLLVFARHRGGEGSGETHVGICYFGRCMKCSVVWKLKLKLFWFARRGVMVGDELGGRGFKDGEG